MVTTGLLVAVVLAGAAAAACTSTGTAHRRLAACLVSPQRAGSRPAPRSGVVSLRAPGGDRSRTWTVRVCGAAAALVAASVAGGVWAAPVGVLASLTLDRGLRALWRRSQARERSRKLAADLPVAADLLAACFRAGADPPTAVAVVSQAVGGPVAQGFDHVTSLLALGADTGQAWADLARDREFSPLASALVRAVETGAPLAETLTALADDLRHARRTQAQATAHQVGVHAVAPLGLCFLPAFVLVGVVPVVVGLAAPALGLVLR
jgi:Flp pilus assembly protein TadB